MMTDEQWHAWLRTAVPATSADAPIRDLWPDLARRGNRRSIPWSPIDIALAAGLAIVLLAFPRMVLALAYHL
jgi:hypothetical protein